MQSKLRPPSLLVACAVLLVACASGTPPEPPTTAVSGPSPTGAGIEIRTFPYPTDYVIFQGYLDAIGGRPGRAGEGTIEATVLSVNTALICPYQEEKCRIEPYPRDSGFVRVDRILSYSDAAARSATPSLEVPAPGEPVLATHSPGALGTEPEPAQGQAALVAGREYQALFVLTAGPVLIRYALLDQTRGGEIVKPSTGALEGLVGQPAQTPAKVFLPIPQVGGRWVFTTQVGSVPEIKEKSLAGLRAGSRFQAHVRFDGILYVEEYDLIP